MHFQGRKWRKSFHESERCTEARRKIFVYIIYYGCRLHVLGKNIEMRLYNFPGLSRRNVDRIQIDPSQLLCLYQAMTLGRSKIFVPDLLILRKQILPFKLSWKKREEYHCKIIHSNLFNKFSKFAHCAHRLLAATRKYWNRTNNFI